MYAYTTSRPGRYFNPRPPRGGRLILPYLLNLLNLFQSTPSARRATAKCPPSGSTAKDFNPRPPRGGRLLPLLMMFHILTYFNPRPPRGGRLQFRRRLSDEGYFNPRPPRGGRRLSCAVSTAAPRDFNPRPPRGGRLRMLELLLGDIPYFNPRPPRGGRRFQLPESVDCLKISIHALREEGD